MAKTTMMKTMRKLNGAPEWLEKRLDLAFGTFVWKVRFSVGNHGNL
tara:strand:+ start:252 stop:389 length:138 start_codon:yes stop_codon:yes gene_type:complete